MNSAIDALRYLFHARVAEQEGHPDAAHRRQQLATDALALMMRENGHWLMSKGTYQIEGERVVITREPGERSFGGSYAFARGVLYAPRGPSPQVVWRQVSDR